MHRCASCVHDGPEGYQTWMCRPRPPSVELREDALDNPIGLNWITREEVSRGLDERTFTLDHSGVVLIADRRHAPTFLTVRCSCSRHSQRIPRW
jgi:hypothetical protein